MKAPDSLAGDRTQGSQQYSIWTTCVDCRAAELLPGSGTWARGADFSITSVAYFTESPDAEQPGQNDLNLPQVVVTALSVALAAGYGPNTLRR